MINEELYDTENNMAQTDIANLKDIKVELETKAKLLEEKQFVGYDSKENFGKFTYFAKVTSGYILSIYSCFRVFSSFFSVLFLRYDSTAGNEEKTSVLDKALFFIFDFIIKDTFEVQFFSVFEQCFSLSLMAVLIIVNFRSLLITLQFLYQKVISRSDSINEWSATLILAYLIGLFYFTSITFLVFSLPISVRNTLLPIIGDFNLSFLRKSYDVILIIGSGCCVAVEMFYVKTLPSLVS